VSLFFVKGARIIVLANELSLVGCGVYKDGSGRLFLAKEDPLGAPIRLVEVLVF
jgi:hypothetical protein